MKQFLLTLFAVLILPVVVQAGCSCHSGDAVVHAPAIMSGPVMQGGPVIAGSNMIASASPIAFAPPPGTVGRTYFRISHPIPEDEHPRSAMLAVRDQQAVQYLRVQQMGGFRMKNGIWLFETNRPLFPGQDTIMRVEARHESADVQPYKVKFVRLIPGRIVYLDFGCD